MPLPLLSPLHFIGSWKGWLAQLLGFAFGLFVSVPYQFYSLLSTLVLESIPKEISGEKF